MRKKLVVGNWKMHGRLESNRGLLEGVRDAAITSCEVAVCVSYPYIAQAQSILADSGVTWGAQNCSEYDLGAYTGEVAPAMLADFGCRYVLLGHSERRTLYGETDAVIAAKFGAARAAGLTPILCVGETLTERVAGETLAVIDRQLAAVLNTAGVEALRKTVLAYEPVWAVGTGRTATPDQVQEVHAAVRAKIAAASPAVADGIQILYGGSVKPQNARELFAKTDVDGGLIGGASLVLNDFLAICRATN